MATNATGDGNYGCQIWIDNTFKPKVLADFEHKPRFFEALVDVERDGGAMRLRVISAHAAHIGASDAEQALFWERLAQRILEVNNSTPHEELVLFNRCPRQGWYV